MRVFYLMVMALMVLLFMGYDACANGYARQRVVVVQQQQFAQDYCQPPVQQFAAPVYVPQRQFAPVYNYGYGVQQQFSFRQRNVFRQGGLFRQRGVFRQQFVPTFRQRGFSLQLNGY